MVMAARRVLHDEYFHKAKREGYVARSAYKLLEVNEKKRLIRRGDRVLDLGCAPGSWLQVARDIVGPKGEIIGVDLTPIKADFGPTVRTIVGDAFAVDPAELLTDGRRFDVLLSDMAPNTAGNASDHHRSVDLCERALDLAPSVVKTGGNLAMKVFEGERYPDLLERTKGLFATCKGFKPKATREVSREMYIVATGLRPGQ